MAKITIHIELDSQEKGAAEMLAEIAGVVKKQRNSESKPVSEPAPQVEPTQDPASETTPEPKQTKKQKSEPKQEAKPEPTVSIDEVRAALAEAKRAGKSNDDLRAILKANGAAVVSDLDPSKYNTVLKAVKAL